MLYRTAHYFVQVLKAEYTFSFFLGGTGTNSFYLSLSSTTLFTLTSTFRTIFLFLCWRSHHDSGCGKLSNDSIAEATALLQSTRCTLEDLRKEVRLRGKSVFQDCFLHILIVLIMHFLCLISSFFTVTIPFLNSLTNFFPLVWVPAARRVRPCSLAVALLFESGYIRYGSAYDCLQSGLQHRLQGLLPERTPCP